MSGKIFMAAVAAMVLCSASAQSPWFDAGIDSYDSWPSDGSDKTVQGQGVWTGTQYAKMKAGASALNVSSPEDAGPDFNTAVQKNPDAAGQTEISATVRFTFSNFLPEMDGKTKFALSASDAPEIGGVPVYCCLALDPAGATNKWTALEGAAPSEDSDASVSISIKREGGRAYARYTVNGATLTLNGSEWVESLDFSTPVGKVGFRGAGVVSALSGAASADAPTVELAIPAKDNVLVASVRCGGVEIPLSDGVYRVPAGAVVTVSFKPAPGFVLADCAPEATYVVFEDKTLASSEVPRAVNAAAVVTVNEVMASNGSTLTTANGGSGLDWIELKNNGDEDVNLDGWYLFDDSPEAGSDKPKKKIAKWTKIEGTCIVPAHGFKIVWADKTFEDFADGEAWTRIGLSTDGETVWLADADGNPVSRLDFPSIMKDVSYGPGRRERTVLAADAPARWRLPGGEWRDASGPLGMPGSTNGFTLTSYKLNSTTGANIETVRAAIAGGKYSSKTVVRGVQTIAYQDSGTSRTEFAPYTAFSTLGVSGDYFAVKVEGVVFIPRAGSWTFSVGSDDGFGLVLSNAKYSFASEFSAGRGYGQSPSAFHIPEPGAYNVELLYFERTGSSALDFSVAEGDYTDYETEGAGFSTSVFKLVGSAESGVTHAGAWAGYAATDVSADMLGVSASAEWESDFNLESAPGQDDTCLLKVRHADGFTATLNGVQVAAAPVAGKRALADALQPAVYAIPAGLLRKGANKLEITAFNDTAADNEFLLSATVTVKNGVDEFTYFKEPTPLAENTTAGWGGATPAVQFGVPHGWKTEPFQLELSCPEAPDAAIYYTLDGSSPTKSSYLYTGPITVSRTTCVRAAVPREGSIIQTDASATYLFLSDVIRQSTGVVPAGFPADKAINSQAMVYGMDQSVVNGADAARLLDGFTNSIPALSLVIDPKCLFDPVSGIYVNASGDGRSWERMTMVEQIDPVNGAANEFSAPAGIRIRGAFSRNAAYPKHSLRLFFRPDYGMGSLDFPLFGSEGADSFEKIDLRTSQNYSWANGDNKDRFVHEVFSRDSQRDMGEYYTRSRFCHLFINGRYWGMYQTEERGDEDYAETYNGGDKDNYDVIKTSQPGYVTGAAEGDTAAWEALWNIAVNQGFTGNFSNNYMRIQGRNADGTRNPDYPVYLNVTNLVSFMLCAHYTADVDSPANDSKPNNLYALRDRVDGDAATDGFFYLRHDAEHSMGTHANSVYSSDSTKNGTELANSSFLKKENFNPAELNYRLAMHPEYKMTLADLFYKHCLRPGGAFTAEKARERFQSRMAEIDNAVVCEAARWARKGQTRAKWLEMCDASLSYIDKRIPYMLQHYRKRGWYPSIDAPQAVDGAGARLADGAFLSAGETIAVESDGTVYYTLGGADPRLPGGELSPEAIEYDPSAKIVPAQGEFVLRMRARSASGEWSALDEIPLEGEITAPSDQAEGIRIAAVMTSTADGGGDGSEFLVLTNILDRAVSLDGLVFNATNAKNGKALFEIAFGEGEEIAANSSAVFTKSGRWPGAKFSNGRVSMSLTDLRGKTVQTAYIDAGWWDSACDGTGAHFIALETGAEITGESQWKPSFQLPAAIQSAVAAPIAANDGLRVWLNGMAQTHPAAVAGYSGDLATLEKCWLVDVPPEADPEIAFAATAISFDPASGTVTVSGQLAAHGVKLPGRTNGRVRLYMAETPGALRDSAQFVELGAEVPADKRVVLPAGTGGACFFKLKIE